MATISNLKDRRVYGPHFGVLIKWYAIDIYVTDEVLRLIDTATVGRFYLGMRSIAFEDSKDATAFILLENGELD